MKVALALMLVFAVAACVSGEKKCNKGKANGHNKDGPCLCTRIFRPICGEDGRIYANICEAGCNKVKESKDKTCCSFSDMEEA